MRKRRSVDTPKFCSGRKTNEALKVLTLYHEIRPRLCNISAKDKLVWFVMIKLKCNPEQTQKRRFHASLAMQWQKSVVHVGTSASCKEGMAWERSEPV